MQQVGHSIMKYNMFTIWLLQFFYILSSATLQHTSLSSSYVCENEIVFILDDSNSLIPRYFVQPRELYRSTDTNLDDLGVSFLSSDKSYINYYFSNIILSYDQIKQICVMFLDEQDKSINPNQL